MNTVLATSNHRIASKKNTYPRRPKAGVKTKNADEKMAACVNEKDDHGGEGLQKKSEKVNTAIQCLSFVRQGIRYNF